MFYIANKPCCTTKTSVSKTHKNGIFPNGVVHGCDQKIGNFVNNSFSAKYTQRKVFAEVLVTKQAFLDNINMDLEICKIDQEKVSGNVLVTKSFYNPL